MKKIIALTVLISSFAFAQSIELKENAAVDSIDLHSLVAKQMASAIEKQLEDKLNPKPAVEPFVVEKKVVEKETTKKALKPIQAEVTPFLSIVSSIPWQYKVFGLLSVLIMTFVLTRRVLLSFTRSSKKTLKKKIGLMREEKVGGSKENPKLARARRSLKDNLEMLKQADGQLGKRAKQLNISKGELLLATRLKLYEVGKS